MPTMRTTTLVENDDDDARATEKALKKLCNGEEKAETVHVVAKNLSRLYRKTSNIMRLTGRLHRCFLSHFHFPVKSYG